MIKKVYDRAGSDPLLSSVVCFAGWELLSHILIFFADRVWVHMFSIILCFGMIYPAGALVMFFRLGRRHGILWVFYGAVTAAAAVEYALWSTYRAIMPNMIIMTALCLVFGCGIGSCFADKTRLEAEREARRKKRTGEDKPYESILGDKK